MPDGSCFFTNPTRNRLSMKQAFTFLALAVCTAAAAQAPYHRDLAVLEINREAPRTEFV